MARFLIDLCRQVYEHASVGVEADSEEEAIEIAMTLAQDDEVDWDLEYAADIEFDHIISLDDEDETDEE